MTAPVLSGDALAAVRHRGSHLQSIASSGSGTTEVVAQRFAGLVADGADPAGIIALTFTERAAGAEGPDLGPGGGAAGRTGA